MTTVAGQDWRGALTERLAAGGRVVTLYGRRAGDDVVVTAVIERDGVREILRTTMSAGEPYDSMTEELPALHAFERELHEQCGLPVNGHPWLKPIRFEGGAGQIAMRAYPWYTIEGRDVHEVAVGPIHAGVIEPGSFRFMCLGERVLHLEIQLGYQHRGVEQMLRAGDPRKLAPLVETAAGDTSVANTWAYAKAIEELAGVQVSPETDLSRALLLELERVAMHLASLAGLATDIGHLQGASTYGRLRTTVINTSMRLCGSRFGRSGVRPGAPAYSMGPEEIQIVQAALDLVTKDVRTIDDLFLSDFSVRHRLQGIGIVDAGLARQIGLVGVAGRASGRGVDRRLDTPDLYPAFSPAEEPGGDCWARTMVRVREIQASLTWLRGVIGARPGWRRERVSIGPLAASTLAVAAVEGFRGEVVHCVETDADGGLLHYKLQDPSLVNWLGLALCMRGGAISDFPICNKSFDLSYCGHDL